MFDTFNKQSKQLFSFVSTSIHVYTNNTTQEITQTQSQSNHFIV